MNGVGHVLNALVFNSLAHIRGHVHSAHSLKHTQTRSLSTWAGNKFGDAILIDTNAETCTHHVIGEEVGGGDGGVLSGKETFGCVKMQSPEQAQPKLGAMKVPNNGRSLHTSASGTGWRHYTLCTAVLIHFPSIHPTVHLQQPNAFKAEAGIMLV